MGLFLFKTPQLKKGQTFPENKIQIIQSPTFQQLKKKPEKNLG